MRNELIIIVATVVVAGILYMFFQKKASVASNETDNMRSSLDSAYAFQGDIWEQEDRIIQYHISNALCEKSNYGEEFSKLNEYEKVFLVMDKLDMEVNNGGFDQFRGLIEEYVKISDMKTSGMRIILN